jgi:hypothetical protein
MQVLREILINFSFLAADITPLLMGRVIIPHWVLAE